MKIGEVWKYTGPTVLSGSIVMDIPQHSIILDKNLGYTNQGQEDVWLCDVIDEDGKYKYQSQFGSKGILQDYVKVS